MSRLRTLLARAERMVFEGETADILFKTAIGIGGTMLFGLLAIALVGGAGFGLLSLAAILLAPTVILLLLSQSLRARHPISVPLIWLLCGLSLMVVRHTPSAGDGVEPQWLIQPGIWLVAAAELCLVALLAWFAWHLWAKGAFTGTGGTDP